MSQKTYKRYLEPNDNPRPLTNYMAKRIKKRNLIISNHEISPSNGDVSLIQESETENDEVMQSIQFEDNNIESNNDNDDFFHLISDQLIHPNLQCRTADAIIMILAYFLRHNLTWVALEDLLELFHNVLGDESYLPKTKYFFKKCFGRSQRAVFHFYCKTCMAYLKKYDELKSLHAEKNTHDTCTVCGTEFSLHRMNKGHFFIELPLREQLEKKLSENVDILNYNTNSNSSDITDIFDGELYKELRAKVGPNPLVTLTLNTDGVRVFKSKSKASLWPIQMFVNEVPPNKRLKQDNIILTGIWFGKDANVELYLKPLHAELKDLDERKINGNVNVRVFLTFMDSVARCKLLKLKQYNGEFGCTYCLHPGFMVGASTTSRYILTKDKYSLRTHASTLALMKSYLSTGYGSFGITGVSPLIGFKDYDLIRGTIIDYLHCILEGNTSAMMDLWFDSENHREKYYITPRGTEVVNKNINNIKPLRTFSIKPRKIEERKFWKAHEFKYWLLYYGVPCLKGTLKEIYLNHFSLLSEATFLFLKAKIPPSDYQRATNDLSKFTKDFQLLYGEEKMVYNVHLLDHVPKCVKDCGPLWAYSNFNFESNNGSLVKHVNGTTDVEHQIASKYSFQKVLASLRKKSESTFTYFERMNSMRVKNSEKIGDVTLFGNAHKHKLESYEKPILLRDSDYIMAYHKFFYSNDVYFSITYKRAEQTNDTVVLLKDQTIGQIALIFKDQEIVFLLLKILKMESVPQFPAHIKKLCKNIADEFIIVPAEEVSEKMLLISTTNENYVSQLPNQYEGD